MTIAKDFASKFAVAFVAAAMILTAFAPAVQAAEHDDLQTTINDLLAQVAALQAQLGDDTTPTTSSCDVPTAPLTVGSQGAGVTALQNILISGGHSIPAGATGYFGAQTKAALAAWQAASGVAPAVGYYGPISMAALKASCTPDDDSDDDSDDDMDDDMDDELQGEGSLDMFELDDASDDTIEENQEDAEIGEIMLEAQDGDIEISRIDVSLVGMNTPTEADPWQVFDTVSLWVDGEMVAEMDASDEDEYLDEDDGSLRFSDLDLVAMEDEEMEILVSVSVQDGIDGAGTDADWDLVVEEVRYFDADGVATDDDSTDGIGTDTASFEIVKEGEGDELSVRTSTEDPDSTTIELEDDKKSEWVSIFAFDLDASDSDGDVVVNGLTVTVDATSNGTIAASSSVFIADAMLVIDGEEYDDYTITGSTMNDQYVFDFDDEAMIDAESTETVEFRVEFKALALANEGATVQASVVDTIDAGTNVDVDAESEGGENIVTDGSATGEVHTLRTSGAILEAGTMSQVIKANTDVTTADDEGVFKIEFDVTAFEDDLYIEDSEPTRGTVESNRGVNYQILLGGVVATSGIAVATLDSDAELEAGRFLVQEGNTETFTLTVEFDPSVTGSYKLQLYSLNFNTVNADANTQQRANPEEDYDTNSLTI